MSTQAEADEACDRACAEAYTKALAKAYAEASVACTKIRKAHEACAAIRKAYDKAIKAELSNPISKKIIEQPAQPEREWVALTDAECQCIYDLGRTPSGMMEMVEAKLKEKNT